MTATQFRAALARLDLEQVEWARIIGRDGRTVRKWIAGDNRIPPEEVILLRLLLAGRITIEDIQKIVLR